MAPPTTNKAITVELFQAKALPPPEMGTCGVTLFVVETCGRTSVDSPVTTRWLQLRGRFRHSQSDGVWFCEGRDLCSTWGRGSYHSHVRLLDASDDRFQGQDEVCANGDDDGERASHPAINKSWSSAGKVDLESISTWNLPEDPSPLTGCSQTSTGEWTDRVAYRRCRTD